MSRPPLPDRLFSGVSAALAAVAMALACAVIFSFAFTPLRTSQDEFWHLKTGQWIVEHGRLPENDIFTYTAENVPWDNHEWLTQVLIARVFEWGEACGFGGWRAVILLKTMFVLLAFAGMGLLLAQRRREAVWTALAAAMMAALARRTFQPRPPFITYFLLALALWMLIQWRAGRLRPWLLWLLPPLFALWSNLHGGWLAGLIVVGAFWAEAAWEWVWEEAGHYMGARASGSLGAWGSGFLGARASRPHLFFLSCFKFCGRDARVPRGGRDARAPGKNFLFLSPILAACLLATLLNPYGYKLYLLPWRVAKDPFSIQSINELIAPDWSHVWILEGTILTLTAIAIRPVRWLGFAATLVILSLEHLLLRSTANPWLHTAVALPVFTVAILRLRRPGRLALLLLACFFSFQGIHHVRHLSLMAVILLPPLAWGLAQWAQAWERQGSRKRGHPAGIAWRGLTAPFVGCGALLLLAIFWIFSDATWLAAMHRHKWLCGLPALIGRQLGSLEWPSYYERNLMLASGLELQPVPTDTKEMKRLIPTNLPEGQFMIQPYPVDAVNFLLRARLPGRLWNNGNDAGYLMWRLSPEKYKVFTDNRYDIYGGQVIREEKSVLEGWNARMIAKMKKEGVALGGDFHLTWRDVLDRWQAQTIIVDWAAPINCLLANGGWVRVWEDYTFNIWVRDTPENKAAIQRAQALARQWPLPVLSVIKMGE